MARRLIGAVVLLLALAGCGGDPTADPPPAPSTSPVSTTPSASASVPAMPDAAKENTKAGAVAFVRHYLDLINYAQATGDVDALQAVESASCRSCADARSALARIYGSGGHIVGGEWRATIRSAAPRPDLDAWSVFTSVAYGTQTVTQGTETTHLKGGKSVITFVVHQSSNGWQTLRWSRGS